MIAIVDPDAHIRKSCEFLFSELEADTLAFETAEDMLEKCRGVDLAALVTEINLPRMSGLELLDKAKAAFGQELPVLVLTHQGDVRTAVNALNAGASDFMEKTEIGQPLAHRVRELMRARRSSTPQRNSAR